MTRRRKPKALTADETAVLVLIKNRTTKELPSSKHIANETGLALHEVVHIRRSLSARKLYAAPSSRKRYVRKPRETQECRDHWRVVWPDGRAQTIGSGTRGLAEREAMACEQMGAAVERLI